jgi:hypothetical protein
MKECTKKFKIALFAVLFVGVGFTSCNKEDEIEEIVEF